MSGYQVLCCLEPRQALWHWQWQIAIYLYTLSSLVVILNQPHPFFSLPSASLGPEAHLLYSLLCTLMPHRKHFPEATTVVPP